VTNVASPGVSLNNSASTPSGLLDQPRNEKASSECQSVRARARDLLPIWGTKLTLTVALMRVGY